MSNKGTIVGIDNWYDSVTEMISNELKISPKNDEESTSKVEYELSNSDVFSRIYSRISKSTLFSYVDNESSYDSNTLTLIFTCDYGKIKLYGNLDNEVYSMEVTR